MVKIVKHSTNGVIQFTVRQKNRWSVPEDGVRRLSVCPGGVPASRLRCCQATLDSLLVVPGPASITNIGTLFSFTKLWFLHILTPFWTEVNPPKRAVGFRPRLQSWLGRFCRRLPVPVFKDGFPAPVTADLSQKDAAYAGWQYVSRGEKEAFSLLQKQIK